MMKKNNQATKRRGVNQRISSVRTTRIDQVQEVLRTILTWELPADVALSQWFKKHRFLGARDRHEVAESVFDVLRHLRRYRHYAQSGQGAVERRLAILGLLSVMNLDALMNLLEPNEREWLSHVRKIDVMSLPLAVRHSLPDWLAQVLETFDEPERLMSSLNHAAPLDLRVNTLKNTRDEALEEIAAQHTKEVSPTPYSPWGLRLLHKPALNQWPMFTQGAIEVQDEGSQLLGLLVSPKRGEMVIDYCAGAGGKTLLLGALMRSTGRLYAFDVSATRLAKAKPRLARSGLSNVTTVVIQKDHDERVRRLAGKAHRVLVDAPCTGMGTLRRNPDLKWRQSPEDLQELCQLQAQILERAATLVQAGGRLVYSTCSLLPEENERQIEAFLAKHPDFERLDVNEILAEKSIDLKMSDSYLKLRPDYHGTDGFFAAVMQRKK